MKLKTLIPTAILSSALLFLGSVVVLPYGSDVYACGPGKSDGKTVAQNSSLSNLSKANIAVHAQEKIPEGSIIFVINHFATRRTY